ncbi:MAG: sigma-54-dependent Fis family transcriptional regulator [Rhodospirillaceae bacterium]|nr:sigma-54-dependent Fis family transcriptional regulator [Rhodospirillaceae bacterium]
MTSNILVVDDEDDIRRLIGEILRDEGFNCREADGSEAAIKELAIQKPDLIILDIWLQTSGMDGLALLEVIKEDSPDLPVIMISGHADIETAVNAIKIGAYDFIEKPFEAERLLLMAGRAIDAARLRKENEELRRRVGQDVPLIGVSNSIAQLKSSIQRVAPTESRVLISGPPGVGKEVVARLLHAASNRADGPLIVLNCAIMAPERMEVELFGSENNDRGGVVPGIFEKAHGGTILLDEVADMPLETQSKILRVLQEQSFSRVGGGEAIEVNVRVIAITNRDLQVEMVNGNFREDLYYRLCVVPIIVPALKSRPEDIPGLIDYFMEMAATSAGLPRREIGNEAMACLQSYDWPGNLRQLRNVVDWMLIMVGGNNSEPISADSLPPDIASETPTSMRWKEGGEIMTLSLRAARELFEKQYLKAQVLRFGGSVSKTAQFVGMERSALHRKLKALGITEDERIEELRVL